MNHVTDVHDRAGGTIPSGGIMKSVESADLLSSWERVLDTQTRLFGPQEIGVLARRGIGACSRGILEVGSGNGDYTCAITSGIKR